VSGSRRNSPLCSSFGPEDIVSCRKCSVGSKAKNMPKTKTGFRFICKKCLHAASLSKYHDKRKQDSSFSQKKNISNKSVDAAIVYFKAITDRPDVVKNSNLYEVDVGSDGSVCFNLFGEDFLSRSTERITKGNKGKRGYYSVFIKGKNIYSHRIVADAFFGRSDMVVNHIDRNPLNNDFKNLEYVSVKENVHHSVILRDKKKAYKHKIKSGRVWYSRILIDGKDHYLGSFFTQKEAIDAYNVKANEIYEKSIKRWL